MTYKDFTEMLLLEVQSALFPGQTVKLQQVLKTNDTPKWALIIRQDEETMCPTIYLEDFFHQYEIANGEKAKQRALSSILSSILDVAQRYAHPPFQFRPEDLSDFSFCKDKICLRLLNRENNQQLLADAPTLPFHDLIIAYFLYLPSPDNSWGSVLIKNFMSDGYQMTAETLFPLALANTMKLFPAELLTITTLTRQSDEDIKPELTKIDYTKPISTDDLYCNFFILTNSTRYYGASVLLYPDLLETISKNLNNNFFLIPSSIHETLVLPLHEGMSASDINQMIYEVNSTSVPREEILHDQCFFFDKDTLTLLKV